MTFDAQKTLKTAAKAKNTKLYTEIANLDLIAKEFKVHAHCYKSFTRGFSTSNSTVRNNAENNDKHEPAYDTGNFDKVIDFIRYEVLSAGKAVSVKSLHKLYGLNVDDTRYRSKLKQKLLKHFGNQIVFLAPTQYERTCEIIVPKACLSNDVYYSKEKVILDAANILRNEIIAQFNGFTEKIWPPSTEELSRDERKPPDNVYSFLNTLIKPRSPLISIVINSIAQDLVYAVTRGKVIQEKHFLLALGLHNLTGSRHVIDILHKMGHCISYSTTCEIDTALAEQATIASRNDNLL